MGMRRGLRDLTAHLLEVRGLGKNFQGTFECVEFRLADEDTDVVASTPFDMDTAMTFGHHFVQLAECDGRT